MKVVGYTYDADTHCPDCTKEYVESLSINDEPEYSWEELVENEVATDSENNPIHPLFYTDEAGDSPDHCSDCGAFIDTSWTGETMNYAIEALAEYALNGEGNTEALDEWRKTLYWCVGATTVQEAAIIAFDNRREVEKDATTA